MDTRILRMAEKFLFPLQFALSIYLLFRGHNFPGGGFIGGLVLSMAITLRSIVGPTQKLVITHRPRLLIGVGLGLSFLSGIFPMLKGHPFLTGFWNSTGHIGNVLFFDIGVYILVCGVILQIVKLLKEGLLD